MDWLKRILGLPNRQNQDSELHRNPTWEEIRGQRENPGWPLQRPPDFFPPSGVHDEDIYEQFHGGTYDPFSSMFRQMNDSFGQMNDVFGQMNDMFAQMDGIFSHMDSKLGGGYHYYNPGQIIISDFPDSQQDGQQFLEEQQRQAPRDKLLKVPDSSIMPDPKLPPYSGPRNDDDDNDDDGSGGGGHHGFGDHFGFHSFDPMSLFERFFRDFGMGSFESHPEHPMLPGPSDGPDEHHSRESLLKKDSDLDDRDLSQLPSDGPRYTYEGMGPGYQNPGSGQVSPSQPKSMFRSSTTVRIRRPDGTIHEEKRYRDSTGREEVIVTDTKPDDMS